MLYALNKVKGIEHVFVNQYSVSVHLHELFEVGPQIDKAVENCIVMAAIFEKINATTKLVIRTFPNRNIREYTTTVEICDTNRESFYRPLRASSEEPLKRLGKKGRAIVESLIKIPGVIEVAIEPYEVRVEIAPAFEWKDVEPYIFEVIAKEIGDLNITK